MCSGQLSLLTPMEWEMSSSLQAAEWRFSVVDWGGGMSASCKQRVQRYCSLKRAIDGRIVRCGIISSCQSAAISEIVEAFLATSSSCVRSDIANTGIYLQFLEWHSRAWGLLRHTANSELYDVTCFGWKIYWRAPYFLQNSAKSS